MRTLLCSLLLLFAIACEDGEDWPPTPDRDPDHAEELEESDDDDDESDDDDEASNNMRPTKLTPES